MAMAPEKIETFIREAFPDAVLTLKDLRGDHDHYALRIESESFSGKSRVQQHQMVYKALKGHMGSTLHALALETVAKD